MSLGSRAQMLKQVHALAQGLRLRWGQAVCRSDGQLELTLEAVRDGAGRIQHVLTVSAGFPPPPQIEGLCWFLRRADTQEIVRHYTTDRRGQIRLQEQEPAEYQLEFSAEWSARFSLRQFEKVLDEVGAVGRRMLSLDDSLARSVRGILEAQGRASWPGRSPEQHGLAELAVEDSVRNLLEALDALYVVPAAAAPARAEMPSDLSFEQVADSILETSPPWFTNLLDLPAELAWRDAGLSGPWQVRVWTDDQDVLKQEVSEAHVSLTGTALPPDVYLCWEVTRTIGTASPTRLVGGVFRILPREQVRDLNDRLSALSAGRRYDFVLAENYLEAGLYGPLLQFLDGWRARVLEGSASFIVYRTRAAVYAAMHHELAGDWRMGDPEGIWAAALARHCVSLGYRALGLGRTIFFDP